MKLVFDCRTMSHLLSQGLDEKLPHAERARMRLHLVMCQNCRNVEEQMDFMRRAMRRLGREDPEAVGRGDVPD